MAETYIKTSHWSDSYSIVIQAYNGSSVITSQLGPAHSAFVTNSVSGFKNPKWRDQVAQGLNATTSCTGSLTSGSNNWADCYLTVYDLQGHLIRWYSLQGIYPCSPTFGSGPSTSVITDVTNRCIRSFLHQFEQAFSSDNLTGRSIKHLQHDLHSISNPMAGLRAEISSYLSRLEKGVKGIKSKSRLLSEIRAAYLELTFGIQPFTEDVTSILLGIGKQRLPVLPISASATGTDAGSSTQLNSYSGNFAAGGFVQNVKTTSSYSVRYKGAVRTHSGMDGKVGFIQSQRLLPQDWVPTLFSILPYAWMVDYFTNIGDVIDGFCFRWSDLAWGCVTTVTNKYVQYGEITAPHVLTQWPLSSYRIGESTFSGGNASFQSKSWTRSPMTSADLIPRLVFTIPTRPKQWLNMMAVFLPRITKLVSLLT